MHSYEDRIRAVRLYMKLRKRTGATIRQLGYLRGNRPGRISVIPSALSSNYPRTVR